MHYILVFSILTLCLHNIYLLGCGNYTSFFLYYMHALTTVHVFYCICVSHEMALSSITSDVVNFVFFVTPQKAILKVGKHCNKCIQETWSTFFLWFLQTTESAKWKIFGD